MFLKILVAVIVSIAAAFLTQSVGITVATFLIAMIVVLIIEGVRVVPQQQAWVIERLGKFHAVLPPGLNVIVPFIDRVAYRHSLKEVPLDIPEQVCITKDNTQLAVDGIIYYQVSDPKLASYGSSDYVLAISQLAQTALRSEVGKMELDKTFESRSAVASPCALLIAAVFWPSELSTAACFSPSATLICCWRSPSDLAISARFSRSAVICCCIERRMASGGVRFFTS